MNHGLLNAVAVYNTALRRIQRLNLGSVRKSPVINLEMSAMSASLGTGELLGLTLTILKQSIWTVIAFSSSVQFSLGSLPDLYTC